MPEIFPYPVGTVVHLTKTLEFAVIRKINYVQGQRGFLHYLVEIDGKQGLYCAFHDAITLEHLPEKIEE